MEIIIGDQYLSCVRIHNKLRGKYLIEKDRISIFLLDSFFLKKLPYAIFYDIEPHLAILAKSRYQAKQLLIKPLISLVLANFRSSLPVNPFRDSVQTMVQKIESGYFG